MLKRFLQKFITIFWKPAVTNLKCDIADCVETIPGLLKWMLIAVGVGLIVGTIGSGFSYVLVFANDLRLEHTWILYTLPFGGLAIVFLYRFFKNDQDKGTNTVVASIQESSEIPFKMAPLIFVTTAITHLCGGSSGREGAAIQLGGSIAKKLGKALRLDKNDQRTIIMCGMSAGFSALFGTPMAAAVFSLEVVSVGIMHYAAIVPCVTASFIAHFVAKFCKVAPEVFPVVDIPAFTAVEFFQIVVFAAAVALVSIIFCYLLHQVSHLYEAFFKNPYVRIFAAGLIIIGLTFALGTRDYLGSGMSIIEHVFHTGEIDWYAFLLKMLFTALTLGAGFKGGEIVPSFCIGAAFGCAVAGLLGLPAPLVAACGMVGVFCGVTNCPIASLLIAFELFGFAEMPYYLTTIAVSYMVSGYESLYGKQKIVYSKTQTTYEEHQDRVV